MPGDKDREGTDTDTAASPDPDPSEPFDSYAWKFPGCPDVPAPRAWHAAAWFQLQTPWELPLDPTGSSVRSIERGLLIVGGLDATAAVPPPEGFAANNQALNDVWFLDLTNLGAVHCPWQRVGNLPSAVWGHSLTWQSSVGGTASFLLAGGYAADGSHTLGTTSTLSITHAPGAGPFTMTEGQVADDLKAVVRPDLVGSAECDPQDSANDQIGGCYIGECSFSNGLPTQLPTFFMTRTDACADPFTPGELGVMFGSQDPLYQCSPNFNPFCQHRDPFCANLVHNVVTPGLALGSAASIAMPDGSSMDVLLGGVSGCTTNCDPWLGGNGVTEGLPQPHELSNLSAREGRLLSGSGDAFQLPAGSAFGHEGPAAPAWNGQPWAIWGAGTATIGRTFNYATRAWIDSPGESVLVVGGSHETTIRPRWVHEVLEKSNPTVCEHNCGFCPSTYHGSCEDGSAWYPCPAPADEVWDSEIWRNDPSPNAIGPGAAYPAHASLHLWDPAQGWSVGPQGYPSRVGAAVTTLGDGSALAIGGLDVNGFRTSGMFQVRPSGSPQNRGDLVPSVHPAAPQPSGVAVAGGTAVFDWPTGQVFLFGGSGSSDVFQIDPHNDIWRTGGRATWEVVDSLDVHVSDQDPTPTLSRGGGTGSPALPMVATDKELWLTQTMTLRALPLSPEPGAVASDVELYLTNATDPDVQNGTDIELDVRVGIPAWHGSDPALWPRPTEILLPIDGDDLCKPHSTFNGCELMRDQSGLRVRYRLPFVVSGNGEVQVWTRYRSTARARNAADITGLGGAPGTRLQEFDNPSTPSHECADQHLRLPVLAGSMRPPDPNYLQNSPGLSPQKVRAANGSFPPPSAWRPSNSGRYEAEPYGFWSSPDVHFEFEFVGPWYTLSSGSQAPTSALISAGNTTGMRLSEVASAQSLRNLSMWVFDQDCTNNSRTDVKYLGSATDSTNTVLSHFHLVGLTAAEETQFATWFTGVGPVADLDHMTQWAGQLPTNEIHYLIFGAGSIQYSLTPPNLHGLTTGWGVSVVAPFRTVNGLSTLMSSDLSKTVPHEPLHQYSYLFPTSGRGLAEKRDTLWFVEPAIRSVAAARSPSSLSALGRLGERQAAAHFKNKVRPRSCFPDDPKDRSDPNSSFGYLIMTQLAALHHANNAYAVGTAGAATTWQVLFSALRDLANQRLEERALESDDVKSLLDGWSAVPGITAQYLEPHAGGPCPGVPIITIRNASPDFDSLFGTWDSTVEIVVEQVQHELEPTALPAFASVAAHLSCADPSSGADVLSGCSPWTTGTGPAPVTPLSLIPQFGTATVLSLISSNGQGVQGPLQTRLAQLGALHLGQSAPYFQQVDWCGSSLPSAQATQVAWCSVDNDQDLAFGSDCLDAGVMAPATHPNANECTGPRDCDCNCYLWGVVDSQGKLNGGFSPRSVSHNQCVEVP